MSHLVKIQTQLRDPIALAAACRRLHLAALSHGTAKLSSSEDTILNHCRGPGPHVRGCWVVNLILGKV